MRGGRGRRASAAAAASLVGLVSLATAGCRDGEAADPGPAFSETRIPIGPSASAVSARDLDGDGHLDLMVSSGFGGGTVTLLRGTGDGAFEIRGRVPAGSSPVDLAPGDFDEDGRLDLAVANHETDHVSVLFGTSGGGFERDGRSRVRVDVAPHPHTVAVGDVDEDGHLDLLVDHRRAESILVLSGRGDGTFAAEARVPVGGDPYRWISLVDRDGDGHLDLATPNPRSVALLRGDGTGGFELLSTLELADVRPFIAIEADVDGDDRLDLGVGGGEGVGAFDLWLRTDDGGYRRAPGAPFELGIGPMRATAGDLDGDGLPDFAVTSYVGSEVALLLSGEEPMRVVRRRVAGNPYGVAIGDFDEDGRADFVTANDGSGDVSVFLATGADRDG